MRTTTFIKSIFLSGALISVSSVIAQDIHFSQFYMSPLTLNPALAGTTVWIRAGLQYRTQWSSVTVPYKTIGASFDVKSKRRWIKIKGMTEKYRQSGENGFGWGLNVYNDKAGDGNMGTLQFNGSLAYQIYIGGRGMLAMGLQAGIAQRSIQFNKLYWGSQYDPSSSTGYNAALPPDKATIGQDGSFVVPDVGAGIIYTYKKNERYMRGSDQREVSVGGSLFHISQPNWSFVGTDEKLYMRMVFHGSGAFGISGTNLAILPGFVIMRQGPNQEIFLGSMFRYMLKEDSKYTGFVKGSSISAGGYYRNKDAFVAAALFEFASYGLGISYDFNISGLKTASSGRGGLEVTLRFLNPAPFIYSQASFSK